MRRLLLAFLLIVQIAPAQADALLGRWRSLKTSQGGIGAMYEFHADGRVDFSPGAIVELAAEEVASRVALVDDVTLRLGEEQFRRQGLAPQPTQPLLGEWLGARQMQGRSLPVRLIFQPSGKALLLIAFKTDAGRYTAKAGRLSATFSPEGSLQGEFTVSGGVLSITRSGGRVIQLIPY